MTQFKVGDNAWIITPYSRGQGWEQVTIDGETSRSWLINAGKWNERKFPKKDATGLYTDEQKADAIWMDKNRHFVVNKVTWCNDVEKMRQIAAIVGYVEETK